MKRDKETKEEWTFSLNGTYVILKGQQKKVIMIVSGDKELKYINKDSFYEYHKITR